MKAQKLYTGYIRDVPRGSVDWVEGGYYNNRFLESCFTKAQLAKMPTMAHLVENDIRLAHHPCYVVESVE